MGGMAGFTNRARIIPKAMVVLDEFLMKNVLVGNSYDACRI
jgi:hypothetical protein